MDADTGGEEPSCDDGPTRACTCDDGSQSLSYCNDSLGEYSDCDCESGGGGQNLKCKAGYYTGTFKGKWRTGALDLGGGVVLSNADIEAKGTNGAPGLALTLVEMADNGGGEFPTYEVKNGCVYGTASAFGADSHPFVGTLTGTLDCETGAFSGIMDGKYDFFGAGVKTYFFSGPMVASFDETSLKLDQGGWRMKEKQAKPTDNPWAGGEGNWDAVWKSADSPDLPKECQDFIDMGGASDGGVWDGGGPALKI